MRISYNSQKITITKGIFLVRTAVVPLSSIVRVTVRRSLFLRLFRAKEVEIFCNLGSVRFYLGRDESFPPLRDDPEPPSAKTAKSSTFGEAALGAFSDTHALGGVFLFAAALTRVSNLLGDEYSERLSRILEKLFSDTVDNVSGFLRSAQIVIPRAVVAVAIFALAGWAFAFSKKLLSLVRFRVFVTGERVCVRSGLLTLYEHTLFPNYSGEIYEEGVLSLMLRRAPVRMRGVIVSPASRKQAEIEKRGARSPKTAVWGHCGVPLTVALAAGAGLICVSLVERLRDYELLKTALLCVMAAALYSAAVRLIFMRYSRLTVLNKAVSVTARHSLRLRSAVIPRGRAVCVTRRRNLFNKSRGNVEIFTRDRLRFKVRQIPLN